MVDEITTTQIERDFSIWSRFLENFHCNNHGYAFIRNLNKSSTKFTTRITLIRLKTMNSELLSPHNETVSFGVFRLFEWFRLECRAVCCVFLGVYGVLKPPEV